MRIELDHIGKRYNRHWIFKDINLSLRSEEAYVVLGANGSGKSTLLQILAGSLLASEGRISYFQGTNEIAADRIYRSVSIVAPYIDLIDSYTVKELIDFQFQFKSFYRGVTPDAILELINLRSIQSKPLKEFSSGMRQRIKLALAIFSDSSLLLLDEPTSNLDKEGIAWYRNLMDNYRSDRLVVVFSNQQKDEYQFCTKEILLEHYKSASFL